MTITTRHGKIYAGDIFNLQADVLICSANVFLTLSGGVGGELLRRHGCTMQDPLHRHLKNRGLIHVPVGTVVGVDPPETPYRQILHAVCVDGMYDSNESVITATLLKAWRMIREQGHRSVALPALATGYGRLTLARFGTGLADALRHPTRPDSVTVAIPDPRNAQALATQLNAT